MTDKLDVLVENKNEYLEHLTDISTIPICKFFVNIANNCSSLKEFQNELVLLTKWNKQKQDGKMNTIHKLIEEDQATPQYMLKLLSEIISKSIKIKIIEHKSIIKSLKVYIPEWYEFLYKVCILASNIFWKNPVLFYKKVSSIERQNNINTIEKITKTCIKNAVRSFIPLNKIINELTDITGGGEINITNTQTLVENEEEDDTEDVLNANSDSEDDVVLDANSDSEDDDGIPGNAEDAEDSEDDEDDDGIPGDAEDAEDDDGIPGNAEDDDGIPGNAEDSEDSEDSEDDDGIPGNAEDSEDDEDAEDAEDDEDAEDADKKKYSIINTKESLNDEIVVKPIVVLENTKESLKDDDDEIVMNTNEDIKVIRINKSFF